MKRAVLAFALCALALPVTAAIQTETVNYAFDGTPHVGFITYDDAVSEPRPGVLVIPEWWGLNDYAKRRARQLAEAGYVAFAADMYGGGKTTRDPEQAGAWAKAAKTDLRGVTGAALDQLAASERVDDSRLAALGFCFGGTSALELAYSGADIKAAVSLHGNLPTPAANDNIKASILVLHGAADPLVPQADAVALADSLDTRGDLDWHLVMFGDAEHAFTNPQADSYGIDGVAYNETAATRAWSHTRRFLAERLGDR